MPIYEFVCDDCRILEEKIATMAEGPGDPPECLKCKQPMRRVYSLGGMVFKGTGWPGQAIKRKGEDASIQEMRRKACVLKDQGVVPHDHRIDIGPEASDRYAKKFAEKDLDKLYDKSVNNPSPPKEDS